MDFQIRFESGELWGEDPSGPPLNGGRPIGEFVHYCYRRLTGLGLPRATFCRPQDWPALSAHDRRRRIYDATLSIVDALVLEEQEVRCPEDAPQIQVYSGRLHLNWHEQVGWCRRYLRWLTGKLEHTFGRSTVCEARLVLRSDPFRSNAIAGKIARCALEPPLPGAEPVMTVDLEAYQPLLGGDPAVTYRVRFPIESMVVTGHWTGTAAAAASHEHAA